MTKGPVGQAGPLWSRPRLVIALSVLVAALLLSGPLPVLDEESYLAIAAQLDPLRPYDWWRPWPPWNEAREADAFVYAHPPAFLWWTWLWGRLLNFGQDYPAAIQGIKLAMAAPWALLLGWSVGRLAERLTRQAGLVGVLWLASPICLLGIQRGLMPDLMVTATGAYAVTCWLEASHGKGSRWSWWAGAGLALGLAALTKYPALVMLPVLALHAWRLGNLRRSWPMWAVFCAVWGGVELWLGLQYGRVHLVEVLGRASEIPRGAFGGRTLGVLVRLGLGLALFPFLLKGWRWAWLPAVILGLAGLWLGVPEGLDAGVLVLIAGMAIAGLLPLLMAVRSATTPFLGADERLLAEWALAVVLAVLIGHNFAAPRYLLPAMLPLALLYARQFGELPRGRPAMYLGVALHGVLGLALSHGELRFAGAADAVAQKVIAAHPEGGWFTGEWTFRWRMERAGWQFAATPQVMDALPSGARLVVPTHSGAGPIPEAWNAGQPFDAGAAAVRVVDQQGRVGLYAETLGAMPWGTRPGVLESATVWTRP